jgi:hypothetical protein
LVLAGIVVAAAALYLVVRGLKEGREISFWPPRLGARPPLPPAEPAPALRLPSGERRDASPPAPGYSRFWGRKSEIQMIVDLLRNRQNQQIVAISGMGGVGKTALAARIVQEFEGKLFERAIWVTAQEEAFLGGEIRPTGGRGLTFETLVNEILENLEARPELFQKPFDQRKAAARELLAATRCLLVIDNVESVADHARFVADVALFASANSRVLITSRRRLDAFAEVYDLHLDGLPSDDAIAFLRFEVKNRGLAASLAKDTATLRRLQEATGGAPLAMKLLVGALTRYTLDEVLRDLAAARTHSIESMYAFLYRTAWRNLSPVARKVLLAMPAFPSPANRTAIQHVSTVGESEIDDAVHELLDLSLLELSSPEGASARRYAIHPLTRSFLLTELPRSWA